MRLVQVFVPRGDLERVREAIDATGVDYAVAETGPGEFDAIVSIPAPPTAVEPILSELRRAGLDESSYTVVTAAETVVSSRTEALSERFSGTRISREELQARAA